jgi:hypothetical protein
LRPYLTGGLDRDEGALCIADRTPDVERSEEIEFRSVAATYLRGGAFSADAMTGCLADQASAEPVGSSGRRLRIAGDLDWVESLDAAGFAELLRYEEGLTELAAGSRHTYACFYDLGKLAAGQVIALLRAHPRAIIDGAVWDSPFYVDGCTDDGPPHHTDS